MDYQPPNSLTTPLVVPNKIMMGPGPSNASERVLQSMALPILGHLHPETLRIMDEIKEGCQYIFQTANPVTLCVSASGHGAMEAALCNLVEAGERVLIGVTGIWGQRAGEMARRHGADVRYVEAELGTTLSLARVEEQLRLVQPVLFFVTQGDSSTGVLQPIEGLGALCRKYNCLLLVDTVASLGGTDFYADRWLVDVVYTGSQKVLGAPPGISPISFNDRAMAKIEARKTPIQIYYFDIKLLGDYWNCFGKPRIYHHTGCATLMYGLREALAMFSAEGILACVFRHRACASQLQIGLESMGLEMFVDRLTDRLPTVNAVKVPLGVDWKAVSDYAMANHRMEISGGLGPSAGKIFRFGLMGTNATEERVEQLLRVLSEALEKTSQFVVKKRSNL